MSQAKILKVSPGRFEIHGELSFATVAALWQDSRRYLARESGEVTIDLARVSSADSAGLALLVEWLRLARQKNLRLRLTNPPPQLLAMAKAYNLNPLLPLSHG